MTDLKREADKWYPKGAGIFTPEGAELLQKAFIHGAEYKQEIDIDKFYNWLKTKGKNYISICGTENVGYHLQIEGQFYTELKKAMED